VHDFLDRQLERAIPCGVHDIVTDEAWVGVGTDHDTSAFAVQTIGRWWFSMGLKGDPQAKQLVVTADAGSSNGAGIACPSSTSLPALKTRWVMA